MSNHLRRLACALLTVSLAFTLGCSQNASAPEAQQAASSPAPGDTSPWHMELKVSPEHPSMAKSMTFTLHITDEHAPPVNAAEVNGALTMKLMDMGTTQVKFTPKGNGDYEASMKSMDMSGAWNLSVDASQGPVHAKKSFEFTVYD
ncbi:MAG TPA: FixH family protein [Terriglobales bacterium]